MDSAESPRRAELQSTQQASVRIERKFRSAHNSQQMMHYAYKHITRKDPHLSHISTILQGHICTSSQRYICLRCFCYLSISLSPSDLSLYLSLSVCVCLFLSILSIDLPRLITPLYYSSLSMMMDDKHILIFFFSIHASYLCKLHKLRRKSLSIYLSIYVFLSPSSFSFSTSSFLYHHLHHLCLAFLYSGCCGCVWFFSIVGGGSQRGFLSSRWGLLGLSVEEAIP